ncbi:HopJ type III effector protein [Niabella aquatica]
MIIREEITILLAETESRHIKFADVIAFIEKHYSHTPTAFQNGQQYNTAAENQGSAKILAFAKLNHLSKEDTLKLFAEHYYAVLAAPEASSHQNIRQFIQNGWDGIVFEGSGPVLKERIR